MIKGTGIVELTTSIPLRTTDFDRYKNIKPSAILQLFQEAATRQAEAMGIGFEDMRGEGVLWAVIRTAYDIIEQPEIFDDVQVRTWPHDPSKFSFLRDYQILSKDGELMVKGTSEWVLMSSEDRSFVPLFSVYDGTRDFIDERNYEKKPRKLRDFDASGATAYTLTPPYSSVDLNGHVNNSMYADYIADALSPDAGFCPRSFQIDYRREMLEGKPAHIYTAATEDGMQAKGVDDEGNIMFAALMKS